VAAGQGADTTLALRDELRTLAPVLAGHAELRAALQHPGLGAEQKKRLVEALAGRAAASALARRLLDLLADRGRIALLPDVVEAYAELANAARGVVSAEVASAGPLPEEQRRSLARALGGEAAAVELRTRVEPDLVGGLLVRSGGRTYDGTVRARLAALKQRLSVAGPGSSVRAS
jgi:F-type H+-transporting ATPase subunit delta